MSAGALRDLFRVASGALAAHRLRSALTMLGILIGITSVILLTSLGEGTRRYILSEFTQFGTNVMAIHRGHTETTGMMGAVGGTSKKLTIDDAEALRRVPGVAKVVPVAMGQARVEARGRSRSVFVYGVTSDVPDVWKFEVRQGRFLPAGDPRQAAPLAALGPKLARELFREESPLGQYVKVGGRRFLVVGVMAPKGMLLGFDMDDCVHVPVAAAQEVFNQDELVEIDVSLAEGFAAGGERGVVERIKAVLKERHDGEEDFTVTTQTEMLDTLGRVLGIVSAAVGGIGAISLLVGAIGILTMMWISVSERTAEIGLAKALGASPRQILAVYLLEAALLSLAGGVGGVAVGLGVAAVARLLVPSLPLATPPAYVAAALAVSLATGLVSGVAPARRAARLDPVEALRTE